MDGMVGAMTGNTGTQPAIDAGSFQKAGGTEETLRNHLRPRKSVEIKKV